MTKRLNSKHKVDRRLKVNLWGRPKSPFNTRAYGPGQHGQTKTSKPSDYGIQPQYEKILKMIEIGINEGATLVAGGIEKPEGYEKGYYVKPTVFANVTNDMTIAKEEIFGPVLSIIKYSSEQEAIEIANDTEYGLAGYVQGEPEHANKVARKIRAGQVIINGGARNVYGCTI